MKLKRKSKRKSQAILRSYHHGDLRPALVGRALDWLTKHGDSSFTLRQIASECGVSHVAAYRHFKAKRDILAAIAEKGFANLYAALELERKNHVGSNPAILLLARQAETYVRFAVNFPGYFRAMFHPEFQDKSDFPRLVENGSAALNALRSTVTAISGEGGCAAGEVEPMVLACWASVHGLSVLWLDRQLAAFEAGGLTLERSVNAVVKAILGGYVSEKGRVGK